MFFAIVCFMDTQKVILRRSTNFWKNCWFVFKKTYNDNRDKSQSWSFTSGGSERGYWSYDWVNAFGWSIVCIGTALPYLAITGVRYEEAQSKCRMSSIIVKVYKLNEISEQYLRLKKFTIWPPLWPWSVELFRNIEKIIRNYTVVRLPVTIDNYLVHVEERSLPLENVSSPLPALGQRGGLRPKLPPWRTSMLFSGTYSLMTTIIKSQNTIWIEERWRPSEIMFHFK